MTDKREANRLANVRALIEHAGGTTAFSNRVGKSVSTISQMTGRNPSRGITSDSARAWEQAFGLPAMSLDHAPGHLPFESGAAAPEAPAPAHRSVRATAAPVGPRSGTHAPFDPNVAEIVNALTAIWGEYAAELPQAKFGEVAAYAIAEMSENGVPPTHASLRRLIALLRPRE